MEMQEGYYMSLQNFLANFISVSKIFFLSARWKPNLALPNINI